jgi:hypothetical protein
MGKRLLLAGVLGGVAMFIWMSVVHMVLPLGRTGIQEIPNESAALSAMQNSLGSNSGFYLFPGMGVAPDAPREQQNAAMRHYDEKLASNPSGILIYHPPGMKALTARQLATEFLTEFIEAFIAVWLLAQTRLASFAARIGFVALLGVLAAITTNVPYWNWYGFPSNYTMAYMFSQIIGYLCVGIVAALTMKGAAGKTLTAAA